MFNFSDDVVIQEDQSSEPIEELEQQFRYVMSRLSIQKLKADLQSAYPEITTSLRIRGTVRRL